MAIWSSSGGRVGAGGTQETSSGTSVGGEFIGIFGDGGGNEIGGRLNSGFLGVDRWWRLVFTGCYVFA